MRILLITSIATVSLVSFCHCSGKKYLTPVSMIRPDSLQKITDDDTNKAFENKPQLVKPLNMAFYSVGSVKTSLADPLSKIEFVKNDYEISPVLIVSDNYYSHRYRGWHPYYSSPPSTDIKKL